MPDLKKYEIERGSSTSVRGAPCHRIRALRPIPEHGVHAGDMGGFIAGEHNLSQDGAAWIAGAAMAVDRSRVEGDAILRHHAIASDHATLAGRARMSHQSRISGHAIVKNSAALSQLAHATGNVTVDGPISLSAGVILYGDDTYRTTSDMPWSFRAVEEVDQQFEDYLREALQLDETLKAAFRALASDTPQGHKLSVADLLATPDGRDALLRITRRAGGTFFPGSYHPLDALAVSAQNAAEVATFCTGHDTRNFQTVCSIHPDAVIDPDTGTPWYAGVIAAHETEQPTRYAPVLLEDANAADTLTVPPLRATPMHGQFNALLDAEAAAMERLQDLYATASNRASQPDPVAVFPTKLPIVLTVRPSATGPRLLITMNGKFAQLVVSGDCVLGLDLAEIAREPEFRWRQNQLIAASNPHRIDLHLPEPSAELRKELDRVESAQNQEGLMIMKRDMDLVRSILLEIEENPLINGQYVISDADLAGALEADRSEVQYHLRLLMDAGFVEGRDLLSDADLQKGQSEPLALMRQSGSPIAVERMTWEGHEFLDSVRDNQVWQKTKGYLKGIGSIGAAVLKDVAVAVVKDQISQHTGLDLRRR